MLLFFLSKCIISSGYSILYGKCSYCVVHTTYWNNSDYTEEKCMSRKKAFVLPVCRTVYVFLACIANGGVRVLRTCE